MMLKIRGISNAENLLTGVNRFGHCLTLSFKFILYLVALYVHEGKVSRHFGVFGGQKPFNGRHVFCIMIKIQLLYGRRII